MIKYGLTKAGTQRRRCNLCSKTSTRKRNDVSKNNTKKLKEGWLRGFKSLSDITKKKGVRRETLSRKFSSLSHKTKLNKLKILPKKLILILDGKNISKKDVLILSYEYLSDQPFAWLFGEKENFESWSLLLKRINKDYDIEAVVSDGQKGLIKAVKEVFGDIPHQRCLVHVKRFCLSRLTLNPKTLAGKELRSLVCLLSKINTKEEAVCWEKDFWKWDGRYRNFLKEKSKNPLTNRNWYTHKKIRSVRSHIKNALNDLFLFTENKNIPSTTNCVEGGINSPLTELLWRHRGITKNQKRELILSYLSARRKQKSPTRNVT